MSKQTAYARNLREEGYGNAIYKPLLFVKEEKEGRVGDIAYFNSQGAYKWIANVWNQTVLSHIAQG